MEDVVKCPAADEDGLPQHTLTRLDLEGSEGSAVRQVCGEWGLTLSGIPGC